MGELHTFCETSPMNLLCDMSNRSMLFNPSNPLGIVPMKPLLLTSSTVKFPSIPISSGKHPLRLLLAKIISFNVLDIFPMLLGTQPLNSLFASTTTETGEFPKFSGMLDVKRLSFKNKASSSLSNSCEGNSPSKSLNLRSRYFSAGNPRTTSGKDPTKRLLLTSSSWRSDNLEKLLGIIPQNLFELMWTRLISVNKPR